MKKEHSLSLRTGIDWSKVDQMKRPELIALVRKLGDLLERAEELRSDAELVVDAALFSGIINSGETDRKKVYNVGMAGVKLKRRREVNKVIASKPRDSKKDWIEEGIRKEREAGTKEHKIPKRVSEALSVTPKRVREVRREMKNER